VGAAAVGCLRATKDSEPAVSILRARRSTGALPTSRRLGRKSGRLRADNGHSVKSDGDLTGRIPRLLAALKALVKQGELDTEKKVA
jgi:hypothetical protein